MAFSTRALLQKLLSPLPPAPPRTTHVRRFEGAAGGARLASMGAMPNPAASVLAARGRLASRVRYLVANNPLAASAAEGWQTGLIGTGIVAQSAHPSPYVRALINRRQTAWLDRADFEGLRDLVQRGYSGVRLIRRTNQPLPCPAAGSDFTHDAIAAIPAGESPANRGVQSLL